MIMRTTLPQRFNDEFTYPAAFGAAILLSRGLHAFKNGLAEIYADRL
jgi:hypothetical protein